MSIKNIQLTHTKEEWALLEREAGLRGHKTFRDLFNAELSLLNKNLKADLISNLEGCASCGKTGNQYDVDMELYQKIEQLSTLYCIPVTSILRYYTTDSIIFQRLNRLF